MAVADRRQHSLPEHGKTIMPWQDKSGHAFTRSGILAHSEEESGVFGLFRDTHWIFIGYTDNVRGSLLALLTRPEFQEEKPEGFIYEPWPEERCVRRRDQLVLEYYPSLNLKVSGLPPQPKEPQGPQPKDPQPQKK